MSEETQKEIPEEIQQLQEEEKVIPKEVPKVNGTKKEENKNIAYIVLINLKEKLTNKEFIIKHGLNSNTCYKIIDIIRDMMINKGVLPVGIPTLEGLVVHPCPKHDYAPVSNCINKCDQWSSKDTAGVCVSKEERIPGHRQYEYMEARQLEMEMRRDSDVSSQLEVQKEEKRKTSDESFNPYGVYENEQ